MHTHEVGDRGTGLLEDLADGLRGVTREGLVNEAVVLVERVQAALNDLGNDVGGLAFLKRDLLRVARSFSSTSAGTESRSR